MTPSCNASYLDSSNISVLINVCVHWNGNTLRSLMRINLVVIDSISEENVFSSRGILYQQPTKASPLHTICMPFTLTHSEMRRGSMGVSNCDQNNSDLNVIKHWTPTTMAVQKKHATVYMMIMRCNDYTRTAWPVSKQNRTTINESNFSKVRLHEAWYSSLSLWHFSCCRSQGNWSRYVFSLILVATDLKKIWWFFRKWKCCYWK